MRFAWRDQRLHLDPEFVRNAPTIIVNNQSHGPFSFPGVPSPLEYPGHRFPTPYRDRFLAGRGAGSGRMIAGPTPHTTPSPQTACPPDGAPSGGRDNAQSSTGLALRT